ncbi:MAG: cytochrome P450 [Acidimicrobiales bacterium]
MSETTAPVFNPFEPGYIENPYNQLAALREGDPVHETPLGFWFITRYDDVAQLLREKHSVEERNGISGPMGDMAEETMREILGDRYEEVSETNQRSMLSLDPPDHTRLRRLVSKAFTPRMMEELRPLVQSLVDGYLDTAEAAGGMNVISGLAFPLPFEVISQMLGMPDTDRDKVRGWSSTMVRSLDPVFDPDLMRQIAEASEQMVAFVDEAIAWKRNAPADDLLSALIAAEEEGDKLSAEELRIQVILLYIAGHETTVNLIGNGVKALLENPDQLQKWRDDPSLDDNAVEELLRYDAPVQFTRRIPLTDIEIRGKTVPKGTFIAASLASANRDPELWGDDADELRLDRDGANRHVSFGGGVHHCLGAYLAKLEAKIAIGTLIRRFPTINQSGDVVYNGRFNLRGLDELPVTFA